MKVSQLLGERFKERAFEIESQNLMTRGGYMKLVGNGIYSLFTPTKRIQNKIEQILRDNEKSVAADVLADGFIFNETDGYVKEWKINTEKVTLGVKKN